MASTRAIRSTKRGQSPNSATLVAVDAMAVGDLWEGSEGGAQSESEGENKSEWGESEVRVRRQRERRGHGARERVRERGGGEQEGGVRAGLYMLTWRVPWTLMLALLIIKKKDSFRIDSF